MSAAPLQPSPSAQAEFAAGLLDAAAPVPAGLVAWNGSNPVLRYAVYRNNVAISAISNLAETFPASCAYLGAALFRQLAARYLRSHPAASPVPTHYGAEFPAFLAQAPEVLARPETADLARLEYLRVECFHAADAEPMTESQWAAMLAAPEQLPYLRFSLHPSVRTLDSLWPVVTLWVAQQGLTGVDDIDPTQAHSAVLVRDGLDVFVHAAAPGLTTLLKGLADGLPLGAAADAALRHWPEFDLVAGLATLIRLRLLAAVLAPAPEEA